LDVTAEAVADSFHERIVEHAMHYDYLAAELYLKAWSTFLDRPSGLMEASFPAWYKDTMGSIKEEFRHGTKTVPQEEVSALFSAWEGKELIPRKRYHWAMALSRHGHLTPAFLRNKRYAAFTFYNLRYPRTLRAKSVLMANPVSGENRLCEPDYKRYKDVLKKAGALRKQTLSNYAGVRATWRSKIATASTVHFWQNLCRERAAQFRFVSGCSQTYDGFISALNEAQEQT
jgi:hypothetical protein